MHLNENMLSKVNIELLEAEGNYFLLSLSGYWLLSAIYTSVMEIHWKLLCQDSFCLIIKAVFWPVWTKIAIYFIKT